MIPRVSLAGVAVLLIAMQAAAQPPPSDAPTELSAGQTRAKAVIDRDVYSSDNVEIGEVEDLILDPQNRVVLAVIEVESNLGFTSKYVAVPYDQLRSGPERRYTLAMTREQLRVMPGFNYRGD